MRHEESIPFAHTRLVQLVWLLVLVVASLGLSACGGGSLGSDAIGDGQSEASLAETEQPGDAEDTSEAESVEDTGSGSETSVGPGACEQLMSFPYIPPSNPDDAVMVAPSAVAAYDEKLWVTDPAGGRVLEFTTSGTYAQHWSAFDGMGAVPFRPHGIAVDALNMYVTDVEAKVVYKTTRSGVLAQTWGQETGGGDDLISPKGIALDDKELFVTDLGRVQVYSTSGTLMRTIGTLGDASITLDQPAAIALSADEVYVADAGQGAIMVYTRDGVFARRLTVNDSLVEPSGVSVGDGLLWVTDRDTEFMLRVATNGAPQKSCGGEGSADGRLSRPRELTWFDGHIYLADTGNKRLIKIYPY
jgi:hypothetical protein